MAKPRTPTNLLLLHGAHKKHPERLGERANEPKNLPPFGNCPDWLNPIEKIAWIDIVLRSPAGVFVNADEIAVEQAARLLARVRCGIALPPEQSLLKNYLSLFGMTPADRSRVSAPPQKPANKFAKRA